jgi:hypothetical protein
MMSAPEGITSMQRCPPQLPPTSAGPWVDGLVRLLVDAGVIAADEAREALAGLAGEMASEPESAVVN